MGFPAFDHQCMSLALRLARRGLFTCDPNPRVGCVIARDGEIVGRGWHQRAGEPHAEIHALAEAGKRAEGATAYVTLEPCSHHGKTPPCALDLLEARVERVVVAMTDPNPQVSGAGITLLVSAGVKVETGLMESQARSLNRGFFKRHTDGRPWVRIKTAISLDGRTALANGESQWISSPESRRDVQSWRARSSAIITGIGTVLADDPRLSARVEHESVQPSRVVLDSRWRTPATARLFEGDAPVIVLGSHDTDEPSTLRASRAECIGIHAGEDGLNLEEVMRVLAAKEFNEVQVEAGPALCGALLEAGLVDEILVYQAPVLLGQQALPPFGIGPLESMSARTHLKVLDRRSIGADTRYLLKPVKE